MRTESVRLWLAMQGDRDETLAASLARDLIAARDNLKRVRIFCHQVYDQGDLMLEARSFALATLELLLPEET